MNIMSTSQRDLNSSRFRITKNTQRSSKNIKSYGTDRNFTTRFTTGNMMVTEMKSPTRIDENQNETSVDKFQEKSSIYKSISIKNSNVFDKKPKRQNYDEELVDPGFAKLKHQFEIFSLQNQSNDNDTRKYRMYEFIHDKKRHNKVKYNESAKIGRNAIPIPKGTVSVMLNTKKKNYELAINNPNRDKINVKSKFKIKWKMIQWLMNNKKENVVELLKNVCGLHCKFGEGHYRLNKKEFNDFLSSAGLGGQTELVDKMFFIHDETNCGSVDYREVLLSLEICRDTTYQEKLKFFMTICDLLNTQYIDERSVYDIFKIVATDVEEKTKLRKILKDIVSKTDTHHGKKICKKEFYNVAKNHFQQKLLMTENIKVIQRVDKMVENDLEEHFQSWTPLANNIVKYKEGIHYPLVNKLLKIFEDNENLVYEIKKRKNQYDDKSEKDNEDSYDSQDYGAIEQK